MNKKINFISKQFVTTFRWVDCSGSQTIFSMESVFYLNKYIMNVTEVKYNIDKMNFWKRNF